MTDVKIATAEQVAQFVNPASNKKLSQLVADAVAGNHIVASFQDVSVPAKKSPNGKDLTASYIRLEAQDVQGMAACNGGKIEPQTARPAGKDDTRTDFEKLVGACDRHNYGLDLDFRSPIRAFLIKSAAGPEAAVKTAVKALLSLGYDADMVVDSPKYRDYPGIAAIVARVVAEL